MYWTRQGRVIPYLFAIVFFGVFALSSASAGDQTGNKVNRVAENITNTLEVINGLTGETSRQMQSIATNVNEIRGSVDSIGKPGAVNPSQPVNPPKKKKVASIQGTTNCYPFDPDYLTISEFKSGLGLMDSTHPGRAFATFRKERQNDAEMALQAIRTYGMNQVCYTPGLTLYLVSGQAAQGNFQVSEQPVQGNFQVSGQPVQGNFQGERCLQFDPGNLSVEPRPRKAKGSDEVIGTVWGIMNGPIQLFGFVDNEPTARTALANIQQYGFTNSCFAGIPYLRR